MPNKPKKPCVYRNCRELTVNRYCETHAKEYAKNYNRNLRDKDSNKRYGRKWRGVRATYLAGNPLCERCGERGRLTPATVVHHKLAVRDGGTNFRDNLQALCAECHSRLHASVPLDPMAPAGAGRE